MAAREIQLSPGPTLTQQDILSLPSPHPPIVNPPGTLAAWPVSTYDFATYRTERSVYCVNLARGRSEGERPRLVKRGLDNFELAWLDRDTLLFLRPVVPPSDGDGNQVTKDAKSARVDHAEGTSDEDYAKLKEAWKEKADGTELWTINVDTNDETKVGQLPVSIANIRISTNASGSVAIFAFSATVYPDGSVWTVKAQEAEFRAAKKKSDIRVYDSTFVRRWDEWMPIDGELRQLHYIKLHKDGADPWKIETERHPDEAGTTDARRPKVTSPLAGTKLECPVGSFGSAGDYSLSQTHLALHSKDPGLNPAFHSRTNVYLVNLDSATSSEPRLISSGSQGASGSPILSDDGKSLAWLEMRQDGNEADRNRVMLFDLDSGETTGLSEHWDRSPARIEWSRDADKIYAIADEHGHVKLFEIEAGQTGSREQEPKALTERHSVASVASLDQGRLVVSVNSFTHPNELYLLEPSSVSATAAPESIPAPSLLASLTRSLLASKTLHEGESFWFAGADGRQVHGWILFPPSHPACHKSTSGSSNPAPQSYPLAHLTTGGPQSQATDGWSNRWNFNAHAAKGYITIVINRTGSTGFGQEFCDRIRNDWAGAPFRDLVAGVNYIKKTYPEVDPERMATLGGSYGGFMQNWIEGHNEEFGFACIVNFQGIFLSTQIWYTTEELYFTNQEFGGAPWQVPDNYNKFNPANHVAKWKTPMLVIHNSKDYRVVDSEGIAAFNVLQALKIPSRFITFPSENHWDLSPPNNIAWHEEVFKWIGHWTKTTDAC
ncbi:hypothetical protein JCM11491_003793 [Sporobolomyces phaffii]